MHAIAADIDRMVRGSPRSDPTRVAVRGGYVGGSQRMPGAHHPVVLARPDADVQPVAAGTRVVHHVYNFQSHNWPVGSDLGDILNRMWSLFESSPRPG